MGGKRARNIGTTILLCACGPQDQTVSPPLGASLTAWDFEIVGESLPFTIPQSTVLAEYAIYTGNDDTCSSYWRVDGTVASNDRTVGLLAILFPQAPKSGLTLEMPRAHGVLPGIPAVAEWEFAANPGDTRYFITGGTYYISAWTSREIAISISDADFCQWTADLDMVCVPHDFAVRWLRRPGSPEPGWPPRTCLDSDRVIEPGYVDLDGRDYCQGGPCR